MRRNILVLGAYGSFLVAGLHLLLVVWMLLIPSQATALMHFFGGPDLGQWGMGAVAAATFAIMAVFIVFAFYALANAGRFHVLPFQRSMVIVIGILYVLRGLVLVPELVQFVLKPGTLPPQQLGFSVISLTIGLLHLVGLRRSST
jgi:hypothetical protein